MSNPSFQGGARPAPHDANLLRFGMMTGGRFVQVDLPISVLQAEFGASKLEPLAHFNSHRDVIEAAAGQAFLARPETTGPLLMTEDDFATKASRSQIPDQDGG